MYHRNIDDIISQMRMLAVRLQPHTFPRANPEDEDDISILKRTETCVDGYNIILNFSISDYENHNLETLQVLGSYSAFLPFHLTAKLAKKFLGGHHLYLVELMKENRKIYCWTVCTDKQGKPVYSPHRHEAEECDFEGFEYSYLSPSNVNFY